MNKSQKEHVVQELGEVFSGSAMVVVVHYRGLSVTDMTELRNRVRKAGASIRVTKNSLARLALVGTPCEGIGEMLTGPVALAFSDEPVGVAKALCNFAKENDNLVVLGGSMDAAALDAAGVRRLATLPSLDELRGKLIGLLTAPASKIARTVAEPGAQLARVVQAYASS